MRTIHTRTTNQNENYPYKNNDQNENNSYKYNNQNQNYPLGILLEVAGKSTTTKLSVHLTGAAGTSTVTEMRTVHTFYWK